MITTMCIVHDNENALKFTSAVHQLRREKKFHSDIYQQLPDRCCSCEGKEGLAIIDLNALRKICHSIQISWAFKVRLRFTKNLNKLVLEQRYKSKRKQVLKDKIDNELEQYYIDNEYNIRTSRRNRPDKFKSINIISASKYSEEHAIRDRRTYRYNLLPEIVDSEAHNLDDFLILQFSTTRAFYERKIRLGRFIGKQGRHIRRLENQYKIRINIVTETSSRKLRQDLLKIMEAHDITNRYDINNIYLIFTAIDTSETEAISYDEIKEILQKKWNIINQSEQLSQKHQFRY